MKALAFPIIVPRYQADGITRNTLDVTSPTIGADILALIQTATPVLERFYPTPRGENVTNERTDTVYEEAPSGRKVRIDGVGGIRTFMFELWAKDGVHQILRELKKVGCTEIDVYMVDVAGNIWGIKDSPQDTVMRGYTVDTATFDVYKMYATDTTTQKIMMSFDLDRSECEENSYVITADELGYSALTLKGLISGYQTLVELDATHVQSTVTYGFGTASNAGITGAIKGLLPANFTLFNVSTGLAVPVLGAVETADGVYSIEYDDVLISVGNIVTVSVVNATGYDVVDAQFTSAI
jgi:hypothetical protein